MYKSSATKLSSLSLPQKYLVPLLFLSVFLIYVLSPVMTSYDSRWSVFTSLSILHEGNINLNEYTEEIEKNDFYAIRKVNEDYYSIFPVGTSVIALPFVALAELMFDFLMHNFDGLRSIAVDVLASYGIATDLPRITDIYPIIEKIIASFFTALTVVLMFKIGRLNLSLKSALYFALLFAFGTAAWSTTSRALWQHAPSMMLLALSLYWLLQGREKEHLVRWVAVPLAVAFIVRPTNAVPIFFFSIFILLNHRKQFLPFVLVAVPFAFGFFAYSKLSFGTWLPAYYDSGRVFNSSHLIEAMFGNLVSPARGLLIFSPFLLFALPAMAISLIRSHVNNIGSYLTVILICHWLVVSSFPHWWGGHSYGPRFFSDMLPFLFYFLIPVFRHFKEQTYLLRAKQLSLVLLVSISLMINFRGAWHWDVYLWNTTPADISKTPERIWSWTDAQFLRISGNR